MGCKFPMVRVSNKKTNETIKILGQKEMLFKGMEYEQFIEGTKLFAKHKIYAEKIGRPQDIDKYKYQLIPCGQCTSCREQYQRNWATRLALEASNYPEGNNWFVTLTYRDEKLPGNNPWINQETGEIYDYGTDNHSLEPKHLTDFIKRVRKYFEYNYNHQGIRYYACGEYGGKTQRPHYHIIFFNMPLKVKDLIPWRINELHQQLYLSPLLEEKWGMGFVTVGEVTWSSCAYVARYVTKKLNGALREEYIKREVLPEYSVMSRKPGIGYQYYVDNKGDMYLNDEIIVQAGIKNKTIKIRPPTYYDKLFDIEDPDYMELIKEKRQKAGTLKTLEKISRTTMLLREQFYIEEKAKHEKFKKLIRTYEATT